MTTTKWIVALVLSFFLGMFTLTFFKGESEATHGDHAASAPVASTEYTCSMHPQIRLPQMGQCPICFMDLIPVKEGDADESDDERLLVMSNAAVQLADIRTAPVVRADMQKTIRLQSQVAYDETRLRQISAWLPGRIDRKFVDYTGIVVQEGEHLVELYSPELVDAQENLLQALESMERSKNSDLTVIREVSKETYRDAREKLLLLGLREEQVTLLERTRKFDDRVTIYSPASGIVIEKHIKEGAYVKTGNPLYTIADLDSVWLIADVYESDINWLRYGQEVTFSVHSFPGETFSGRVSFISPTVDKNSRTIKIRINVDNEEQRLKPGMFATAWVHARLSEHGTALDQNLVGLYICPMHHELVKNQPGICDICGMDLEPSEEVVPSQDEEAQKVAPLLIPRTAPLMTGKRAVVYVRLPKEKPTFEFREVTLGPRVGDKYVVLEGVEEGEEVVFSGNFKIDASRQILARSSMMSLADEQEAEPDGDPETVNELTQLIGKLQDAYFAASVELAEDRSGKQAMDLMVQLLAEVPMARLTETAQSRWSEQAEPLARKLKRYSRSDDLEEERETLDEVSRHFIKLLDYFGAAKTAYQFHCPMGPGDEGSSWIQSDPEIYNPYMGSRMLRCGSPVGELRGRP